ncbi:MAG: hypothetical protein H6Q55_3607 [Deltaproteobacteria bacterium]|jgi:hypothetical protein|nr:hypothetical protein [Deltaproteobacteria bacterium]
MKSFAGLMAVMMLAVLLISPALAQEKAKPAAAKEAAALAIARAVVATGVENKEPTGAAEAFPAATEKVFCFVEATGISKDMEITTVWYQGDKEVRKINLGLKAGPKWRTWAEKKLYGAKGAWKVEIKDPEGKVLKEVKFKVE